MYETGMHDYVTSNDLLRVCSVITEVMGMEGKLFVKFALLFAQNRLFKVGGCEENNKTLGYNVNTNCKCDISTSLQPLYLILL